MEPRTNMEPDNTEVVPNLSVPMILITVFIVFVSLWMCQTVMDNSEVITYFSLIKENCTACNANPVLNKTACDICNQTIILNSVS